MKMNYHRTVWISFIKYHSSSDPSGFESQSDCDTQLRIWDGRWTPNNNRYIDTMAGKYSSTNFFIIFFYFNNNHKKQEINILYHCQFSYRS